MVRPILNKWHPGTAKITYWFPALFCLGFIVGLLLLPFKIIVPLYLYAIYFVVVFIDSLVKNKRLSVAFLSIIAICIQFIGYGFGFLKSTFWINFSSKEPKELFPKLFFN
jgi:hypothetical protein